jgi:two-component system, chemotaxis family, chemotaxis protein CheY
MNILAVDDSPTMLAIVTNCLADAGHLVKATSNGLLAMRELESCKYDLVVSDLNMMVMGGLQLLSQIRSNSQTATLPFILVTTELDELLKTEAREMGASAWMNKPFDPAKLVELVGRFELQ